MQLKAMGCMRAQGYWIARPMSAEAISLWFEEWDEAKKFSLTHQFQSPDFKRNIKTIKQTKKLTNHIKKLFHDTKCPILLDQ